MRRLAIAVLSVGLLVCPGCEDSVSQGNYDQIQAGMSVSQVEDILGGGTIQSSEGTSIGASGLTDAAKEDPDVKTYLWESGNRQIIITFRKGEVATKRKIGF
ncbi:MAG: hypothetical protein H6811_04680 [Phycisphaeraceae bacterium]|nr:hypothetical protein [Phycisphaeraceae bacterium]